MRHTAQQQHESERMTISDIQAVVLCGGLGTRLHGLVPKLPKALAPVAGRPFLDYLLTRLAAASISNIVLCTGHRSEAIEEEYGKDAHCELSILYSIEYRQLGTAGALKNAQPAIRSNPFLLLNGDSLLDVDYEQLISAHRTSGAIATLALTTADEPGRYGHVVLSSNGEIEKFEEKSDGSGERKSGNWINAGVYALDRHILDEISKTAGALSLEQDILPKLVGRGLFGMTCDGFFIDIGVPEDYERAQTEIPRRLGFAYTDSR
jgi:D-glycero-alpha-D-manno-heptose 1-phosphate guanylyltransferase